MKDQLSNSQSVFADFDREIKESEEAAQQAALKADKNPIYKNAANPSLNTADTHVCVASSGSSKDKYETEAPLFVL